MALQIPNEDHFRKLLEIEAVKQGCRYTQIPDVHRAAYSIAKKTGAHLPVYKRPCDGIFSTPDGLAWIELKHQNGQLKPHQEKHLRIERGMHKQAYVLRAKETKRDGLHFTIEHEDGVILSDSKDIEVMIDHLKRFIKPPKRA